MLDKPTRNFPLVPDVKRKAWKITDQPEDAQSTEPVLPVNQIHKHPPAKTQEIRDPGYQWGDLAGRPMFLYVKPSYFPQ